MSKKQRRNLEVISRIDDGIIEKTSKERASLLLALKKRAKKVFILRMGAMAASLLLIAATVLVLVNVTGKQVPVYTGMTVSSQMPTVTADSGLLNRLSAGGDATASPQLAGQYVGAPSTVEGSLADTLGTDGTSEPNRYYAKPGEDVYITIHFDNPDQFEILSFTINGKKYQNHMFESGSDLENIIIKVNVGDAEGILTYTIDAIKYVDGDKIKDVKMDGEDTVEVGVATGKQPTAAFGNEVLGYNSISFTLTMTDELRLLGKYRDSVEAVLFDGERIVARKPAADAVLEDGTTVSFEGLVTGKTYQYALIATYDALDGKGVVPHIINQKTVSTKSYALFDNVVIGTTGIDFDIWWSNDATSRVLSTLSLYKDGEVILSLAPTARSISSLVPGSVYTLVATYENGSKTEQISITFKTEGLVAVVNYLLENADGSFSLLKTEIYPLTQGQSFAPTLTPQENYVTPTVTPLTAWDTSLVFVCRFERVPLTVTLVENNGNTKTVQLKPGTALPTPARGSDAFLGWFAEPTLTTPVTTADAQYPTVYAKWAGELEPTKLSYTKDDKGVTVTGLLDKSMTALVLPAYIEGLPVVTVGEGAFRQALELTSVTLPETLKLIEREAFFNCVKLKVINLPSSLAEVRQQAFFCQYEAYGDGTPLPREVHIPSLTFWCTLIFEAADPTGTANPLRQSGGALYVGGTPVTDMVIPEGVQTIRPHLFAGNTALTSVQLPTSVSTVENYAFAGCTNLKSVVFAADSRVTGLGMSAFAGCSKLESVTLPAGLQSIAYGTFSSCTALSTVTIPASVTRVSNNAFTNCAAVTVENGVAYAGGWALGLADGSTSYNGSLTLRQGTVGIAEYAFSNVWVNGTLTLPEGLKYIDRSAFYGCFAQNTALTIPDSVMYIGRDAFTDSSFTDTDGETGMCYVDKWLIAANGADLSELRTGTVGIAESAHLRADDIVTTLAVPTGIKYLCGGAFDLYYSDVTALVIPASVLYIDKDAFGSTNGSDHPDFDTITVDSANTAYSGAGNCLVELASKTLILGCKNSVIPTDGSVTKIGTGAFFYTSIAAIHIPASVTEIESGAFLGCGSLKALTFAENSGLKVIGSQAFRECRSLTGVILPSSLTTIYYGAFSYYKAEGYIVVPDSITSVHLPFMSHVGNIYYMGVPGAMAELILPPSRVEDFEMSIYFYSATKPTENHGSYWRFVDGVPTVWTAND